MALTEDGEVYTWGHNASGQVKPEKSVAAPNILSRVAETGPITKLIVYRSRSVSLQFLSRRRRDYRGQRIVGDGRIVQCVLACSCTICIPGSKGRQRHGPLRCIHSGAFISS